MEVRDIYLAGKEDTLTISTSGNRLVLEDPNHALETRVGTQVSTHRVEIPQDLITGGQIMVKLNEGDDQLTVRPASGETIVPRLIVNDLGPKDDDQLVVDLSTGGSVTRVQYDGGNGAHDWR